MSKIVQSIIDFIEKNILVITLSLTAIIISFVLSNNLESSFILEGMNNKITKLYNINGELIADLDDIDNHYDSDGFLVDIDGRLMDVNGDYYNENGELLENENIRFDMDIDDDDDDDDDDGDDDDDVDDDDDDDDDGDWLLTVVTMMTMMMKTEKIPKSR